MASKKSEASGARKRYRVSSIGDLDHRAMGKEIVRADTREPPFLIAGLFSLAVPLLLASFYNLQFSVLLGVLGIGFGGVGTSLAVDMWRAVARARAWNLRKVEVVYGLRSVQIESVDGTETLTFAEASHRPEVTRWQGLRDLMRVRELHSRMDPKTPERLILEWLALCQTTSSRAGPGYVLFRGPEEAPTHVFADEGEGMPPREGLYRVEWASDMAGNIRPRFERLPKRVEAGARPQR